MKYSKIILVLVMSILLSLNCFTKVSLTSIKTDENINKANLNDDILDLADDDIDVDQDDYNEDQSSILIKNSTKAILMTKLANNKMSKLQSRTATNQENLNNDLNEIEELNPDENKCRLVNESNKGNKKLIVCSKVPLFCRNACDTFKRIDFDSNLKKITSFSFGSYHVKENLELNFMSQLEKIDSDSFNGLVVEPDIELTLLISTNGFPISSNTNTNLESSEDSSSEEEEEEENLDGNLNSNNQESQIEYDLQPSPTKSAVDVQKNRKRRQITNLIKIKKDNNLTIISNNAFRGITLKEGARLTIKFKNLQKIQFNSDALNGLKLQSSSSFIIAIENSDSVLFKTNSAKLWKAFQYDELENYDDEADDSNQQEIKVKSSKSFTSDIFGVLFRINITNVNEVIVEKESFLDLKLFNSSTFQLLINKFNFVSLGKSSFSQIEQSKSSNFELNLSNGKQASLSDDLFSNLKQSERSKFIVYINVIESNICVRKDSFSNLSQMLNSTLRITFLLNQQSDLIFNENSFTNLKQEFNSFIQIYVLRPNNFLIDSSSIVNLTQKKLSSFEIWVSKSKSNFTIKSGAFKSIKQMAESSIRLGFTSSTTGSFKQSPTSFVDLISDQTSEVIYDFSQGTNFNLKFPAKRIPRFLPINTEDSNTKKGKQASIEVISWRLYPGLGKTNRPDKLNLQEYLLEENDFCKIVDIPYDVIVRLNSNTKCSCSVYYLYRVIRKYYESDLNWLLNAPDCYRKKYLSSIRDSNAIIKENDSINQKDDMDLLEEMCEFNKLSDKCKNKTQEANENDEERLNTLDKILGQCSSNEWENDNSEENVEISSAINRDNSIKIALKTQSSTKITNSFQNESENSINMNDLNYDDDTLDNLNNIENEQEFQLDDELYDNIDINVSPNSQNNSSDLFDYNLDEQNNNEQEDSTDDDEDDEDYYNIESTGPLVNGEEVDDDSDDNDDGTIEIQDDQEKLIEINRKKIEEIKGKTSLNDNSPSIILFFSQIFKNSTALGLIAIIITSVILISIIVVILIILRCSRKSEGFSIYYDDEEDEDGNMDQNEGNDQDSDESDKEQDTDSIKKVQIYNDPVQVVTTLKQNSENSNIIKTSKLNKLTSFISNISRNKKPEQFNYSILDNKNSNRINLDESFCNNQQQTKDLNLNSNSKQLLVKKNGRKDAFDSTVLNLNEALNDKELISSHQQQLSSSNLLNIKTNPFSLV